MNSTKISLIAASLLLSACGSNQSASTSAIPGTTHNAMIAIAGPELAFTCGTLFLLGMPSVRSLGKMTDSTYTPEILPAGNYPLNSVCDVSIDKNGELTSNFLLMNYECTGWCVGPSVIQCSDNSYELIDMPGNTTAYKIDLQNDNLIPINSSCD